MLNIEHKIMMQMAPNNAYDLLTHPQKLEVCARYAYVYVINLNYLFI